MYTYFTTLHFHSDILSREIKIYIFKMVCTKRFIAALFIIAPNWK